MIDVGDSPCPYRGNRSSCDSDFSRPAANTGPMERTCAAQLATTRRSYRILYVQRCSLAVCNGQCCAMWIKSAIDNPLSGLRMLHGRNKKEGSVARSANGPTGLPSLSWAGSHHPTRRIQPLILSGTDAE